MKNIYFIINPKAKNGQCSKIWRKVEELLKAEKISYLAFFTEYPGHAKKIARQIAVSSEDPKIVVAVGGDGSLHEVMNGIVKNKNITLGFIPGGSGNDFSRGFAIPARPEEALKVILSLINEEADMIDAGRMTIKDQSEYFINNMGVGFDAVISYEVNQSRMKAMLNKIGLGRLVYVYFLLKKLFTYKPATIELTIDGKRHVFEQTWFVTVSNQPFYGGGMKIAPSAVPDDGILDITVVHQLSKWKLLLVFISVFWGKHIHFNEVKTYTGRLVSIQSAESLFVHGDGEHIGNTPVKIAIDSKALQVLTGRKMGKDATLKERGSNDSC